MTSSDASGQKQPSLIAVASRGHLASGHEQSEGLQGPGLHAAFALVLGLDDFNMSVLCLELQLAHAPSAHFLLFDVPDVGQGYLSDAARAIVSMAGSFMYCVCAFAQATNSWANVSRVTA